MKVRKETWDEERERLISYLRNPPQKSDESLDHVLDLLDGKRISPSSRPSHLQKIDQCS